MRVGGHNKQVAYERLGPTLVVAASVILAIRTSRWTKTIEDGLHNRDWEAEIDRALKMAKSVLGAATAKWPSSFQQKDVPWYMPDEDENPK